MYGPWWGGSTVMVRIEKQTHTCRDAGAGVVQRRDVIILCVFRSLGFDSSSTFLGPAAWFRIR